MIFYDDINKQGLCQFLDDLCDTNDTSFPRIKKTRDINEANREVGAWIINADGTWQFDDTNYTDMPRGKGDLVDGQEEYSFDSDYLQIEAIDILDINGVYKRIDPIDPMEMKGMSPEEYFGTDSSGTLITGFPTHYDIKGDTIRLYPTPKSSEVTLTNGLRVSFKRKTKDFTVKSNTDADTTEPGFDIQHRILAYMASIPYCIKYHPERVNRYERKIMEMKNLIIEHYSQREKNRKGIIRTKTRNFR